MKIELVLPEHIHIHLHNVANAEILAALSQLKAQGVTIMASAADLKALANTIKDEVGKFGPAVDALEAAITAALAKLPTVPADVQADIDEAFDTLGAVLTSAQAAVADAADGVDEAAPTP
jgi:predicted sugar kinase